MEHTEEPKTVHRTTIEIPVKLWTQLKEEASEMGLKPSQMLRVVLTRRYKEAHLA